MSCDYCLTDLGETARVTYDADGDKLTLCPCCYDEHAPGCQCREEEG